MTGTLKVAGFQQVGARNEQQDSWDSMLVGSVMFAAIADGMGGMEGGKLASATAIRTSLQWCAENTEPLDSRLIRAQLEASDAVKLDARKLSLEGDMGSTLLLTAVEDGKLFWSSSGDSRIYLVRQGRLIQLTHDHTFGSLLARRAATNQYTPTHATEAELRQLTSWLGSNDLREIDSPDIPIPLQYGDYVLLCSDGCYDALPETVPVDSNPSELAEMLVNLAIARGLTWQDNATCVVLRWSEK
jgi:PPM family protein phosphatase